MRSEVHLDCGSTRSVSAAGDVHDAGGEQQRLSGVAARRQDQRNRLSNAQPLAVIRALHAELKGAYGSPRMVREIRGRGFPASKKRAERQMRRNGIRARHKRRYKATTDSMHRLPVAPNVFDRDFAPAPTNQVWTAALTYIWTNAG